MSKQSEYLSIKEAADFVGKSTSTIRRAIKRGDLTANLVKGKYQVLVGSLVSRFGLPSYPMGKGSATSKGKRPQALRFGGLVGWWVGGQVGKWARC